MAWVRFLVLGKVFYVHYMVSQVLVNVHYMYVCVACWTDIFDQLKHQLNQLNWSNWKCPFSVTDTFDQLKKQLNWLNWATGVNWNFDLGRARGMIRDLPGSGS